MYRSVRRAWIGGLLVVALVAAAAGRAEAATITVGLAIVSSQDVDVEVSPGVVVKTVRSTWGNVTFDGVTVGTYVMRQEFSMPNNSSTTTPYPIPLVTVTLRLDPPIGTHFDTLILQGTVPGVAPNPGQVTTFGSVSAATGSLAFLRGATWTTAVGVGDIPLTFTF